MTLTQATFKVEKECKHSRRYQCTDPEFPIDSIYLKKPFALGKSSFILIITDEKEMKPNE